ncbi:6-bladed beta-propeller [Acidobacteriota bacterium]
MKVRSLVLICSIVLLCFAELNAQSVKLLRMIDFQKGAKDKSISTLIFGKKQDKDLKPGSLCQIGLDKFAITDAVNGLVLIIDGRGKIQKKISHAGKLKLISPVGVCVDNKGSLYVSDSARGGVFRYDARHKYKGIFLIPPNSRITGILFAKGIFFCVDTRNHRILSFDGDGELTKSFGGRGSGQGEFNFPTHIAADNEYIYVTDALNFRIQIFDFRGEFIRAIGSPGRGGGNFSKPKGMAVDTKRRIFVADAEFDNIQIFNFEGEFLYHFGGPGHQDGEFWLPSGVMAHSDGTIWVVDTYNTRIQVFKVVE